LNDNRASIDSTPQFIEFHLRVLRALRGEKMLKSALMGLRRDDAVGLLLNARIIHQKAS
jgi:hypothetical protein